MFDSLTMATMVSPASCPHSVVITINCRHKIKVIDILLGGGGGGGGGGSVVTND